MDAPSKTGRKNAKGAKATEKMEGACNDPHCPIHSGLKTRGKQFEGTVVSDKMFKTVIVEWPRMVYSTKYGRVSRRSSRVKVHNPPCINARVGDRVRIRETRKLAKTKNFVVLEKIK